MSPASGPAPLPPGAEQVLGLLVTAGDLVDHLPVSPTALGSSALSLLRWRRRAAVTAHAGRPDRTRTTFDDLLNRSELGRQLLPDPWWVPAARWAAQASAAGAARDVKAMCERAVRGWAVRDVADLSGTHARVLGEQLLYMAEHTPAWPAGSYASHADWVSALRTAGQALVIEPEEQPAVRSAQKRWWSLRRARGAAAAEREQAHAAYVAAEDAARAARKDALHWVAEHYDALWD